MTELTATLAQMNRPQLLVRAARFAAAALQRAGADGLRARRAPVDRLLREEAELNEARQTGASGYSPTRHVEVLTALLAAAQSAAARI